jgi:hypothetical protein
MNQEQLILQIAEFDALDALRKKHDILKRVKPSAIDYTEHVRGYEATLWKFLEACRANGRFE